MFQPGMERDMPLFPSILNFTPVAHLPSRQQNKTKKNCVADGIREVKQCWLTPLAIIVRLHKLSPGELNYISYHSDAAVTQ